MDYFPLFCRLQGKRCLLVGAGDVAERKARLLLEAGAELYVGARDFSPAFQLWAQQGKVTLLHGAFTDDWLDACWLAIAATNDDAVNQQVADAAEQRRLFCNLVDAPQQASAIMPSIVDRSPLMIAVSSGGRAPVLARLLREKLEAMLPQHLGELAALAGSLRERVKQHFSAMAPRRAFWERFFASDRLAQTLANGDRARAAAQVDALFAAPLAQQGEVVLVGAGPGDAGLLTLKGLQAIQQADVVVYDRLVSEPILNLVRRDAERLFVGKQAGHHCVPQEQINQLLLEQAQRGRRVVRLKGGDPFIFGRGGEELEVLAQHNIPFSVVPGITAASGCAAYSGIPLTHRDHAQSVRFVTGHLQQHGEMEWGKLAAEQQTLVFYMGLSQAADIQQQLLRHGMDAAMPVAIVQHGTTPQQRVACATLQELATLAQQFASPALIIVGRVVSLRTQLRWF
ncbi:siroheme synthase CysG [Pantoea dispersa]|uniref:Siroheme synthase n=1 Tax=Pantoea dispersa TaxID=59814 RepID=A0A8E1RXM2_9GAMM|nr:siroheme synthase CysG [Pantoea dispersa]KTR89133.1 siroheme synthase [Pantoea dispersa]KTS22296.1 siroheme synthase [Pantoea dispersa]KTS63165.1 siroheme synthase [Pantoea dispersa]KTS66984.1 siroheme synthase [Pantoea dispersa]MDI9766299.1 siroheme synthase CysG [Pantoea dispersa]